MRGIARSLLVSLWFMFLTFPLAVIKVAPATGEVFWRWENALWIGGGIFFLSFVWRALLVRKGLSTPEEADMEGLFRFLETRRHQDMGLGLLFCVFGALPLLLWGFGGGAAQGGPAWAAPSWAVLGIFAGALCFAGRRGQATRVLARGATRLTEPGPVRRAAIAALLLLVVWLPFTLDIYRINVLTQTFIWIMLGLGLNIVVGQAGLLVLGYVAFYAVGAYAYALGNLHFGGPYAGFWLFLPIGGLLAGLAGVLLSLPVLRLRGDYLAIVTLGFGEIVRSVLESGTLSLAPVAACIGLFTDAALPAWLTTPLNLGGPAGISAIPYPSLFGVELGRDDSIRFVYFVALCMTLLTIGAVSRLRDSRLGRSWLALREDEVACEAMGINKMTAKLTAFALGACWAGFAGVIFAAKTSFINPTSFTFMESALILSVVVLGGLGSILGVILGSCVLILLPEYLRSFDEYRMLIFGASMVLMMVFRPQGLIIPGHKKRFFPASGPAGPDGPDGCAEGRP